jgi:hypothetical protein
VLSLRAGMSAQVVSSTVWDDVPHPSSSLTRTLMMLLWHCLVLHRLAGLAGQAASPPALQREGVCAPGSVCGASAVHALRAILPFLAHVRSVLRVYMRSRRRWPRLSARKGCSHQKCLRGMNTLQDVHVPE